MSIAPQATSIVLFVHPIAAEARYDNGLDFPRMHWCKHRPQGGCRSTNWVATWQRLLWEHNPAAFAVIGSDENVSINSFVPGHTFISYKVEPVW